MSTTGWADPGPILDLLCLAAEHRDRRGRCRFQLGAAKRPAGNRLLIFLSRHGFLQQLLRVGEVVWSGQVYGCGDEQALHKSLRRLPGSAAYPNAECLAARIFHTADLDQQVLSVTVAELTREAKAAISKNMLGPESRGIALFLRRMSVILHEALDNVREHAYGPAASNGYAGVYARIRSGVTGTEAEIAAWDAARASEIQSCPTLERSVLGKRPGWVEIFVVDLGVGITSELESEKRNPLHSLSKRLFREPVSRHQDREAQGKTTVTGLHQIGLLLTPADDHDAPGDFVRVYSNGEWVGDHLPWARHPQQPAHRNDALRNYPTPPGTMLHFALQPPTASSANYPAQFVCPARDQLARVREALHSNAPTELKPHVFIDCFQGATAHNPSAYIATLPEEERTHEAIFVRPSTTMRKRDIYYHVIDISNKLPHVNEIAFIDVPWDAAIDFAHVLGGQRYWRRNGGNPLTIYLLSQDWSCAAFHLNPEYGSFVSRQDFAKRFIEETGNSSTASDAAGVLREADTRLFWNCANRAYFNEPVLWTSGKDGREPELIFGYLDLGIALAEPDAHSAARRAMRRAVAAFPRSRMVATDEFAKMLIDRDFDVEDEDLVSTSGGPSILLVGSARGTGRTVQRFARGGEAYDLVNLIQHADLVRSADSEGQKTALRWSPPEKPEKLPQRQLLERIPNSPFVIRGGEKAFPMPRFSHPDLSGKRASFYGEWPSQAYDRWQNLDLLHFGHWVYSRHHDLLTISLADAIEADVSENGTMLRWFADQVTQRHLGSADRIVLVYPHHAVADQLARRVADRIEGMSIVRFPLALSKSSMRSPAIISPMSRERLGQEFRDNFERGGRVVILDDGVISGSTLRQLRNAVHDVWEVVRARHSFPEKSELRITTIAMIDRTATPLQRSLVGRETRGNPRFWRWDVPTLGEEGSCPLCAALNRFEDLKAGIQAPHLRTRLSELRRIWRPVPVEGSGSGYGVRSREMPADDYTDLAREPDPSQNGDTLYDRVYHRTNLSRISLAAEICRSTTRKDYPLSLARGGRHKNGADLDPLLKLEILCAQLLLFLPDLSAADVSERLLVILKLLWAVDDATPSTALAALSLLAMPHNPVAIWEFCEALVDEKGFPNDDAFLSALALYHLAGRPSLKAASPLWTMFELAVTPSNGLREPISRLFRVIGWSEEAFHRSPLQDLTAATTPLSRAELTQLHLLLIGLASALESLRPEITVGRLSPRKDAEDVRELASELASRIMSRAAARGGSPEQCSSVETGFQIGAIVQEVGVRIFSAAGLQKRYITEMTKQVYLRKAASALLDGPIRHMEEHWGQKLARYPNLANRWADGTPIVGIVDQTREERPVQVYFDPTVRHAVAEVLSNVIHRSEKIRCPWRSAKMGEAEADMWAAISIDWNLLMLRCELVNAADSDALPHAYRTLPAIHLRNVGGGINSFVRDGQFVAQVDIPLVARIAREGLRP